MVFMNVMAVLAVMAVIKVEEETMKNLRGAVVKRHGKLYGFLKKEINRALQEHAKKLMEEAG